MTTFHDTRALAATKFVPPRAPPGWIDRRRLRTALDGRADAALTLVVAGPGAGKTSLLADWREQRSDGRTAWLSLDAGDADPARFWRGVLTALTTVGAGREVAALDPPPRDVVPALINALDGAGEPCTLILDDFHEAATGAVPAELDALLRHPPPGLRLVIATRIDPPLRLGRLRVAGELAELREAELAFTREEAGQLVETAGIELHPAHVTRLWERTEGWAAGLRLAALALRGHLEPARFVEAFAGDDAVMADYLLAEVLSQLPEDLVDFLLRTSIVALVHTDLAEVLTERPDSGLLLAQLEREHALVARVGDDRSWYRYHPLLRELLQSQLRYRMPGELAELHGRAAGWYQAQGRPLDELRHAAEAGGPQRIASLAGEHWVPLLMRGELGALRVALDGLPGDLAAEAPEVALARAAALIEAGDERGAGRRFAQARAGRDTVPAAARARFDLGLTVVGLLRARLRGDLDAALASARELLGTNGVEPHSAEVADDLRALALLNLGIAELWAGDLAAARRDLEAAERTAADAGIDWLALTAGVHLALQAQMTGRLERARRLAEQALALAERSRRGDSSPAGLAELVLSNVALARNRVAEAEARAARASKALATATDVPVRLLLRVTQARLLLAAGQADAALDVLEDARELEQRWAMATPLRGIARGLTARALMAQGRAAEAERAVAPEPGVPPSIPEATTLALFRLAAGDPEAALAMLGPRLAESADGFVLPRCEMWLLAALAHDALAAHEPAATCLERALDAAEPSGTRRPFVAHGPAVGTLLRRQLRSGTAHRALVEDLLRELERPADAAARNGGPHEDLSDREIAVLRFLPTMMSNQEIASELFVSVNTVKTHLKAIYRKLDVADRRAAIRRARELELLGP